MRSPAVLVPASTYLLYRIRVRRLSRVLVPGLAALLPACGSSNSPTAPDRTPPVVAITSPAAGVVNGVVILEASATDNRAIARVRFKVNSAFTAEIDSVAPFQYVWDTSLFAAGFYDWEAVAYDRAGNSTVSAVVSYTVP